MPNTHDEIAADPRFQQAQSIADLYLGAPARRSPKPRPQRQRANDIATLLSKAQSGYGAAPAGESVAWAALPESIRGKLAPVMLDATGTEQTTGWAIGDLDKRDMMTLRRLMGRDGWQQWLNTQRAQLGNDQWLPEVTR